MNLKEKLSLYFQELENEEISKNGHIAICDEEEDLNGIDPMKLDWLILHVLDNSLSSMLLSVKDSIQADNELFSDLHNLIPEVLTEQQLRDKLISSYLESKPELPWFIVKDVENYAKTGSVVNCLRRHIEHMMYEYKFGKKMEV